ncbi:MAG: M1 family peptidase, partial [Gemmatimonadaceae bacterium]
MLTRTIFGRARRPLIGAIVALALTTPSLGAQTRVQPQVQTPSASVADSSPFRPLDLPTPNNYRTGSGRPGPGYWQQRVHYNIGATLDPARNELHGSETIHYANHAPEALPYLWLFIEQNI